MLCNTNIYKKIKRKDIAMTIGIDHWKLFVREVTKGNPWYGNVLLQITSQYCACLAPSVPFNMHVNVIMENKKRYQVAKTTYSDHSILKHCRGDHVFNRLCCLSNTCLLYMFLVLMYVYIVSFHEFIYIYILFYSDAI